MKKLLLVLFLFSNGVFANEKLFLKKLMSGNFYGGINYSRTKNGITFDRKEGDTLGEGQGWREGEYFEDFYINFMYLINFKNILVGPEIKQYLGYSDKTFGNITGLYFNIGTEVGDKFIFLLALGNTRSKETINAGTDMNNSYNWNFSFEPKIMYKITNNVLFNASIRFDRNIKIPEQHIKYDRTITSFGIVIKL